MKILDIAFNINLVANVCMYMYMYMFMHSVNMNIDFT